MPPRRDADYMDVDSDSAASDNLDDDEDYSRPGKVAKPPGLKGKKPTKPTKSKPKQKDVCMFFCLLYQY